jgi:hypothetical protein
MASLQPVDERWTDADLMTVHRQAARQSGCVFPTIIDGRAFRPTEPDRL